MTDDSNCHCQTCTVMNEPLTLEGDIRYLKAHIESKDRQLADAELRIDIYHEAWQDAEKNNLRLRQEKDFQHDRIVELNDTAMRLTEDNRLLREEQLKPSLGHNLGLQQENERLTAERDAAEAEVGFLKRNHSLETAAKLRSQLATANAALAERLGEVDRLKVELEASRGQVRNQLQIILDLRKEKETLIGDRTSLVEEVDELYEKLGRISTIIDEIVD
jgi:chromosome segregation ATPase